MAEYDIAKADVALAQSGSFLSCGTGGMTRADPRGSGMQAEYELFRPIVKVPRGQRDIIDICMNVYYRVGLLRNVVDMMASFGCQGIQVVHPKRSTERLYKYWFHKVNGPERSERFLNSLYRGGNVVIKKTMAKVNAADLRDMQRGHAQRSHASLDADEEYERAPRPRRNEIPIKYTFLNPWYIETAGGDLASFMGHPVYILRIPGALITSIRTPKTPTQQQMVNDLPAYIREPIKRGEKFIPLDNDKLSVYHYMKDDWQQWAMPITYSILADLILYEKMKLADMAALEGAISHIRLWKLGDLDKGIVAGPGMYQRLHDILQGNIGMGSMDLLWDAAIDLVETDTTVAQFLGSAKYEPILKSIYAGLGIPQSLAGGGQGGAGFTNNAISLKTLIERLQYGRDLLSHFWNNELRTLQEAFGDSKPARVIFDNMSLYDEAAEKMLWFQLYDRHLVDDATLQEKFGMIPDVVAMRIKQEERQRDAGRKPPKATPFHDPQTDHELKKIALQQGTVSPTETGIEKDPKAAGDKSLIDHQNEQAAKDRALQKQQQEAQIEMDKKRLEQEKRQGDELHNQKLQHNDEKHQLEMKHRDQEHKTMLPIKRQALKKKTQIQLQNQKKGVPGQGRPKNKRDSQQRKSPRQSPRVKASLDMFSVQQWARDALEAIVKDTVRLLPERYGVKSARSLTATQAEELEMDRFGALCTTEPFATEPFAAEPFGAGHVDREMGDAVEIYKGLIASYVEKSGVEPTIDKRRDMMASAYAIWRSDGDDGV